MKVTVLCSDEKLKKAVENKLERDFSIKVGTSIENKCKICYSCEITKLWANRKETGLDYVWDEESLLLKKCASYPSHIHDKKCPTC